MTDGAISVDQLLIAQGGQDDALFNYLVGACIADDTHKELSHIHRRERVGLSVETNRQLMRDRRWRLAVRQEVN